VTNLKGLKFIRWFFLIILAVSLVLFLIQPQVRVGDLNQLLEIQQKNYAIPAIAGIIIKNGQCFQQSALGMADSQTPFTLDTPIYIGSLTKSFTALAIVRLSREYNFSLDTPVTELLPEFKLASKEYHTITVKHLLAHASGLSDRTFRERLLPDASLLDGVLALQDAKLLEPPETNLNYFNMGYTVLGLIIERISGLPYPEYLQKEILVPLKLKNTFVEPPVEKTIATGYLSFFGLPLKTSKPRSNYALPAGYLLSTANDLFIYVNYYLNPLSLPEECGIKAEDLEVMLKPAFPTWPYGFGWIIEEKNGEKIVHHGGSLPGYQSQIVLWPDEKTAFVLLTNSGNIWQSIRGRHDIIKGAEELAFLSNTVIKPRERFIYPIFWSLLGLVIIWLVNSFALLKRYKEQIVKPRQELIKQVILLIMWLLVIIKSPQVVGLLENRGLYWSLAYTVEPGITVTILLLTIGNLLLSLSKLLVTIRKEKCKGQ